MWRRIAVLLAAWVSLDAQSPALREAIEAMSRGDFQAAERNLRNEVAARPEDAVALSLLGAALDNLNRTAEAAEFHRRALAIAPSSIDVLNSDAAHLAMMGDDLEARKVYLRVIALDGSNRVANLQLARIAVKARDAAEALRSLDRLQAQEQDSPSASLLRLQALYLSGDPAPGDQLFERLSEKAKTDLNLSSALVNALANARQYSHAETICENALQTWPSNFKVLYSLGVMAAYAEHYGRAREVLETALRREPENVDVLVTLAHVNAALRQWEPAVGLLARAGKLDPRRADAQHLLAVAATELGALDDAAAAWDRYLVLQPADEQARRERSYLDAQRGQMEKAIPALEQFLQHHPDDAVGHYELAQAERGLDPAKALAHFDRALAIDPDYAEARAARGGLLYQIGKVDAAVPDLEEAAKKRPRDAVALDHLGQAYASLDRNADAVRVLRQAAAIDPANSQVLLHYGRALAQIGNEEESKAVLARFRQLGSQRPRAVPSGLVEYLGLTEDQRRRDYRARVEKEVRDHPQDAAAQLAWLKLSIEDHSADGMTKAVRAIAGLHPEAGVLAEAGGALVDGKQYALAIEVMTPIPEAERGGEFYLALAEVLAASGKMDESFQAAGRALRSLPPQFEFYRQAISLLVRNGRTPDALRELEYGSRLLPGDRRMLLLQAGVLELAGHHEEAVGLLAEIRSRWPEWFPVWVFQGAVLKQSPDEARKAFEAASELGAPAQTLGLDVKDLIESDIWR